MPRDEPTSPLGKAYYEFWNAYEISAESVAAGVSYAGSQITRLTAFGDAAVANKNLTYELLTLRRAIALVGSICSVAV